MSKRVLILVVCALLLASCATQPSVYTSGEPGFFYGLLHGFGSLFSLIGSLIWDIRVYAHPNIGRWYDFGFVIGAATFYGGLGVLFGEEIGAADYHGQGYRQGYRDGAAATRKRRWW
jgi:hypothetical protein